MDKMDERESAFESKFAHDEALLFKAEARCCKLFGLWLAEKMGMSAEEAKAYAGTVVSANLEESGFDDVKRAVKPDIEAKGLDISDHILDSKLEELFAEAKKQILSETGA
ncbi:MAG: DUF1476 domain-containing protein [Rhodospirillales bacterium]|nr:DUF1476 domain-containing protein [Alphaproteobacteria bacterium]USO02858.1 MAG: DUF1476 domain-containing protein [Rhodospirillales bacterium]